MDSLGAEVSSKIRAAIKAKLVEQEVSVVVSVGLVYIKCLHKLMDSSFLK